MGCRLSPYQRTLPLTSAPPHPSFSQSNACESVAATSAAYMQTLRLCGSDLPRNYRCEYRLSEPDAFTMAKPKHCTVGLVPLRFRPQTEVLLILRRKDQRYGLPKGHRQPGESDSDTIRRELREETGCEIDLFLSSHWVSTDEAAQPLPDFHRTTFKANGKAKAKETRYYVGTVHSTSSFTDTNEVQATLWASLDQARTLLQGPERDYFDNFVMTLNVTPP